MTKHTLPDWNAEKFQSLVPEHMQAGLMLYLEHGVLPGSFLTAVLENDLKGAFGRADHINESRIKDIVTFLYNYAPGPCWGSPQKVASWVASFSEDRDND